MRQQFGWHSQKAKANWHKHGVTFEQGAQAIGDKFAVAWIDERENYGEERTNLVGLCDSVLLHVTYTERHEHIWIISARRAERHEQDDYFRENSR
ncbi:MAG: BrnT family toxin [Magnetococcales bacterium]|nr:BrnT family toxin [Magnetococcales bacterium]